MKIWQRNKLVKYDNGGYKCIKEYQLRRGGLTGVASIGAAGQKRAKQLKSIREKAKESIVEKGKALGLGDCSDILR